MTILNIQPESKQNQQYNSNSRSYFSGSVEVLMYKDSLIFIPRVFIETI